MAENGFSFETVACLIAVLESHSVTLGQRHYDLMAKLDGKHSGCSFQHQFRKVKARAKELQGELANGNGKTSAAPRKKKVTKKEASAGVAAAAEGKKRGKQEAATVKEEPGQDEDEGFIVADDVEEEAPAKKCKTEKHVAFDDDYVEFFSYQT